MKLSLLILLTFITVKIFSQNSPANFIESRILQSSSSAYTQGPSDLIKIIDSLITKVDPNINSRLNYWYGFALYKLGIYYFSNERSTSEKTIQKAIEFMKSVADKTSDDHMLLGSLISFSINFNPGIAAILSPKSREHYLKAVDLDPKNIRAYYGLARSDFYRPKEYGGGMIVEKNLLKSLSLPITSPNDNFHPTWGREEAYLLLISYYLRENRKSDAIVFWHKAFKEFPASKLLIDLKLKLK